MILFNQTFPFTWNCGKVRPTYSPYMWVAKWGADYTCGANHFTTLCQDLYPSSLIGGS